jgi:hypothetical protein
MGEYEEAAGRYRRNHYENMNSLGHDPFWDRWLVVKKRRSESNG